MKHGKEIESKEAIGTTAEPPPLKGVTLASAKIMEEFLKEGQLHPAQVPTQKGFLQIFAAWIIEDDLPFTTGETPGIKRLFSYMQSHFLLPSDTTVRNTFATIFADLYAKVFKEISVCFIYFLYDSLC